MSEKDWKTVEDALDMWASSQVAIRGHVRIVSEAVTRLRRREQHWIDENNVLLDQLQKDQAEIARLQATLDKF